MWHSLLPEVAALVGKSTGYCCTGLPEGRLCALWVATLFWWGVVGAFVLKLVWPWLDRVTTYGKLCATRSKSTLWGPFQ
jgi:hypothetical protein